VKKSMTSNQKRDKKKLANSNNFLEALRDLGGGIADSTIHELGEGVAKSAVDQLTGRPRSGVLKPDQTLRIEEIAQEERRERKAFDFQREFLDLGREEKLIWSRAEQETKLQIAAILEELKKLASSTMQLGKEVEIAAKQVPVEPGIYHVSFFERLRQAIILFKKRIDESATWLAAFNRRAKRRSYYWAQVKKSGTKFMLSPDRYMATQAG